VYVALIDYSSAVKIYYLTIIYIQHLTCSIIADNHIVTNSVHHRADSRPGNENKIKGTSASSYTVNCALRADSDACEKNRSKNEIMTRGRFNCLPMAAGP
jgi:hypothetical protein